MKIRIIAVGNLKESFSRENSKEYEKRLSRFCDLEIIEISEKNNFQTKELILKAEAVEIKKHLNGFVVCLQIEGKEMTSEEFSKKLDEIKMLSGNICFVIGSSYGLSEEIKKHADMSLSFSKMTFPHNLARIMLLEQIYRAFTISNNITYHK